MSAYCEQFIRFECKKAKLLRDGNGWWVARNGQKMEYWGGATGSKSGCGCSVTKTCSDPKVLCDCDINDNKWREDSGFLADQFFLPVSQLRFGDTGGKQEEGYHTLGKLKCYGMS